jgi:GntR family transcriptional regulator, transcriptional repressor for pyruvate dehydrogenase complex
MVNDPLLRPHSATRGSKVSETIARQILEDITARNLQPGTRLPAEAQMLEDFGIGRASLREALRILEVHGLIRVKPGPGGGPILAEVRSDDFGRAATFFFHAKRSTFNDLLDARLVLEPIMARLAAERTTDDMRERLRENLEEASQLLDDTGPRWGRASGEFHGLIAGMTGNPILDLIGSSLNDIHTARVRPIFPEGGRTGVLEVHQKIADAISDGDADRAEHLSRRHIEELINSLEELNPSMGSELLDWR